MMLNGQPTKNDDRDFDGADTWTDKFKEDLLKEPSDNNEWQQPGNGRTANSHA